MREPFVGSEILVLFKLKHDIRVESKVLLAQREIEECMRMRVEPVASFPTLIKRPPFLELDDRVIHRMMRLLYLGKTQGFIAKIEDAKDLNEIARRATYLREIYAVTRTDEAGLKRLIESITPSIRGSLKALETGKFIDLSPSVQVFNQRLNQTALLSTFFLIPHQTLLEYGSEVLKLPYVTFTKQFTNLAERLSVMERGVQRGIDELFDYVQHEFCRMPWLGLFKEHIGDYVDWAFSDFRTWGLHFIHKHEGKADPWLARSVLNLLGVNEGGIVLDPFCGSGTFIADAPLMGINAYGIDINPLSTMIADVKCRLADIPLDELKESMTRLHEKVSSEGLSPCVEQPLLREVKERDRTKLLANAKVVERIISIKHQIDEVTEGKDKLVRNFLYTILSRSIVNLAEKKRVNDNIWGVFIKDAIDFYLYTYATQEILRRLDVEAKGKCTILTADTHDVRTLISGTVDGVVTSPPYFDALDYVGFSKLPILLLGLDEKAKRLGEATIGSKERVAAPDTGLWDLPNSSKKLVGELTEHGRREKARIVLQYLLDMKACLAGLKDILREGGRIIFVVGRYHHWKFGVKDMQVDGAQVLIDLGEHVGLVLEDELSHSISKIEAGSRIREESIIIWRKDGIQSKRDPIRSENIIRLFREQSKVKQLTLL